MSNIKIFSGSSNLSLAKKIVENIGLNLSAVSLKKFSNNEISVRIEESVRGHDVYLIQTGSGGVNSHLMELLIMVNAAKYASAARITAVLPYLPYSRQTKKGVSRVPITAKLVANMLCSAGVGHVITMQLHAIHSQGFFDVPVDHLSAEHSQVAWIKHNIDDWQNMSLFCLSTCCNERVSLLASMLKVPLGLIHVQRMADNEQKLIVMGDVASRSAVLLLDIVDRCEPVCAAAERLAEAGASKIFVIGTHGLFDEEMLLEIHSSVISQLVVTNTICQERFLKLTNKLTCLDVSDIFAEAIRRTHHGESVSYLSSARISDFNENHSQIEDLDDEDNLIELVVLDPDHILMQRFQRALADSLTKQFERIQLENRETTENLKKHRDEHLEAGNDLFTVQRELAKFQSNLDGLKEEYNNALISREEVEQNLRVTKNDYLNIKQEFGKEREKMMVLRTEMDNIGLRLFYLRSAKEDIVGDIAVMKRAAEKAVEDLTKAENEKMQQDFLLDGLVSEVGRLKEDISLYDAQLIAQSDERCAAKQTLHEAQDEIQSIILERRQLMAKWNSSLIHLTRRNEAYHSLNESLNEQKEQILVLENEIEGYKRNIHKESDLNERLTLLFKKNEVDMTSLKRNITESEVKYQNIKKAYSENVLVLQSVETTLSAKYKEKKEESLLTGNIHEELERLSILKHKLEDNITEEIRDRLALKSASLHTEKMTKTARDQSRHVESELVLMYNLLSKNSLKIAEYKTDVSEIQKYLDLMDKEIIRKNDTINKLEKELGRSKITIERKQVSIDRLNKQYESVLLQRGGVELGPFEITISHLNKNISMTYEEISNLEQQWLKEQNIIVRLLSEKNELNDGIMRVKQQLSLLRQKQIRTEGFIQQENSQLADIEKELVRIQTDLVKVNRILFKEKNSKEVLENVNMLAETDFVRALKEDELECIQLQTKIGDIKEEMDLMLKDIVETQWQVMMYEKKIQMIQESQLTMKSDLGQGEITSMRKEIHRMEVRFKQLKQQQELLIQDMERSVIKRDIMTTRGEALQKMNDKVTTKGATERKILQVKRRIKDTKENIVECEARMVSLDVDIVELRNRFNQQKIRNEEAQAELNNTETQLDELIDSKYSQLMKLQYNQQLAKYYTEVKERKYVRLYKSNTAMAKEKNSQHDRIHSLLLIVDRLGSEHPQILSSLNSVRQGIMDTINDNNE